MKQFSFDDFKKIYRDNNILKNRVIESWVFFLNNGMTSATFSPLLYEHFTTHAGFHKEKDIHHFYNTYFLKCDEANRLYGISKMRYRHTLYLWEYFINSKGNRDFSHLLYRRRNAYGTYSDVNEIIQHLYHLYIKEVHLYLKHFDIKCSKKKDAPSLGLVQ